MKLWESDRRKAELLSYVVSLDAWDGRRIDEPDYDKRHGAYMNLLKVCTFLLNLFSTSDFQYCFGW